MPARPPRVRTLFLASAALLSTGCERALFGVLNRGARPPDVSVVYSGEHALSLDVYRPHGDVVVPSPVVVFFHGGSWQRGDRAQYGFVGRQLAADGVLTIVVDYRTYPRAMFPDFIDDAAQAVAWTLRHASEYGGDPGRVFIAGHSAGAQIVGLLGTDERYLQRAGTSLRQVAGVVGLSGPYDFEITGKFRAIFGDSSRWPDAQVINFVNRNTPPFLLIHGESDYAVEAQDSVELDRKIRDSGGRSELLLLPDGGHIATVAALYDPQRSPAVLPAILRFVRQPAS